MNYDKIGEFIASKRKEKNMTQSELAKKLGVTDKAVSKWERGLGCPDVSILEILSKELDVSILELLKGREIENEVVKVTEADDYIKDTYKTTKNKYNEELKKKISYIIVTISIFIIIIIGVFNFNSYKRVTKKYEINFESFYNDDTYKGKNTSFKYKKEKLKEYINIIENNKGTLTDDEQQIMLSTLKGFYKYYDECWIFSIKDGTKMSYQEAFVKLVKSFYKYSWPRFTEMLKLYKNLTNKETPDELMVETLKRNNAEYEFTETYDNLFRIQLSFEIEEYIYKMAFGNVEDKLQSVVERNIGYLTPLLTMTEEIMEAAGINE
ncbi:MAG: helix-turn-helix transcriptional regulator [Bacilli bacterium]|nr:helix-turn-helix transcriptional regulator [Bacilli bacterium]